MLLRVSWKCGVQQVHLFPNKSWRSRLIRSVSFIRNRSSPAATTAWFAMPLSEKNTFASLADRRGPTSSPGLVRRSWFLGPRQIGNYPFARTVASIEINWFFSTVGLSTVLAIFGLGRRRSRSWEPWRSARTPRDEEAPTRKRKAATSRRDSLASHESRYRADTTRVDDHDNHDKMGTKRDTPVKRRKKKGANWPSFATLSRSPVIATCRNWTRSAWLDRPTRLRSTGVDRKGSSPRSFSTVSG